jgi:starch synthase
LASGVATGFLFDTVTADSLTHALQRAISLYAQADAWHSMQQQGMRADLSWQRSGARYADLYARVIGSRRDGRVFTYAPA